MYCLLSTGVPAALLVLIGTVLAIVVPTSSTSTVIAIGLGITGEGKRRHYKYLELGTTGVANS